MTKTVCISSGSHRARVLAKRDALVVEHISLVPPIARHIHQGLPASFDLDEMIAVGNLALVKAAMGYDPDGAPFTAYARRCITGAIKDTFRRFRYAQQTAASLDNVVEISAASPFPAVDERIDLARRFASLRGHITACLSPLQVAVFNEYYSPAMPDLASVARILGIKRSRAEDEHQSAIHTLRERLKSAA
jgi:RNA polymerase sigma factor (sigma-70 family)